MMTDHRNTDNEPSNRAPTTSPALPSASWLARFIREPLLHYLFLGAALFGVYGYLHSDDAKLLGDQQIVVTEGKIEHLVALFTRTWQRPPTRKELEGLIDDYVREEAAYREGTAMGLDQNDTIIRRRIRQKLDFVADDLASQLAPTDEELEDYLREHADDFRVDSKFTFRQVFFDPESHVDDLAEVVSDLVVTLREDSSVDAREQGDRTLLEFGYQNLSQREVANLFGNRFAAALAGLDPKTWHGPIESSYGVHAVIVDEVLPSSLPKLQSVRDAVRRDWEHARRQELTEQYYQNLLDKYDIVIRWPELEAE
jgi:hypothetical protein